MDNIESFPIKPLSYKYLLIGKYNNDSANIHMGAGRTKKEIMKIARLHNYLIEKTIYKKLEEIK